MLFTAMQVINRKVYIIITIQFYKKERTYEPVYWGVLSFLVWYKNIAKIGKWRYKYIF